MFVTTTVATISQETHRSTTNSGLLHDDLRVRVRTRHGSPSATRRGSGHPFVRQRPPPGTGKGSAALRGPSSMSECSQAPSGLVKTRSVSVGRRPSRSAVRMRRHCSRDRCPPTPSSTPAVLAAILGVLPVETLAVIPGCALVAVGRDAAGIA